MSKSCYGSLSEYPIETDIDFSSHKPSKFEENPLSPLSDFPDRSSDPHPASTNGELKRGPGTFSFRRPFSRGSPTEKKNFTDSKRYPSSPTTITRPMRDYAADLKHLIAEHLELQQEYAKVRQQLVERCSDRSPMSPVSDLSSIPELEPDTTCSSIHSEREVGPFMMYRQIGDPHSICLNPSCEATGFRSSDMGFSLGR